MTPLGARIKRTNSPRPTPRGTPERGDGQAGNQVGFTPIQPTLLDPVGIDTVSPRSRGARFRYRSGPDQSSEITGMMLPSTVTDNSALGRRQ